MARQGLRSAGMITDAAWTDLDKDGWPDLVVVGEWMPVTIYKNHKGKLTNETTSYGLEHTNGLWTALHIADINNDGFDDILAGNRGTNSKLHASEKYPLQLYAGDLDNNGSLDQLLTSETNGNTIPSLVKKSWKASYHQLLRKDTWPIPLLRDKP